MYYSTAVSDSLLFNIFPSPSYPETQFFLLDLYTVLISFFRLGTPAGSFTGVEDHILRVLCVFRLMTFTSITALRSYLKARSSWSVHILAIFDLCQLGTIFFFF